MASSTNGESAYHLIRAEIFYQVPAAPHLLRSLVWQDYDVEPDYPELTKFLEYWSANIDAPVHSVRVNNLEQPLPRGLVYADYSNAIH